MKLVLAIVLFTCNISLVHPSCEENQSPMFCSGSSFIPQVYCIDTDLEKWKCTKKENVRCGCNHHYARSKEGDCIPVKNCQIYGNLANVYTKGRNEGPTISGTGNEVTELSKNASKFLKNGGNIYLLQISSTFNTIKGCVCLKSAFQAYGAEDAVQRTLQCYYNVPSSTAHGSQAQVQSPTRLVSRIQYADFQVTSNAAQTSVMFQFAELGSGVTHINVKPLYLEGVFSVLQATDHCLLLEVPSSGDEGKLCTLWTTAGNMDNNQEKCSVAVSCKPDMVELKENLQACKDYDASEQRAIDNINKKLLSEPNAASQP